MREVKLKDLCKIDQIGKYGIPASAEPFSDEKTRYLRISDIDDYGNLLDCDKKSVSSLEIEKYLLNEGDVVFARTGNSTGRTYYHENKNGELAFAGFLIKFGLDEKKINPKYIKYYTISEGYKQWVKNLSVGSTRGNINAQSFADCPIILPPRKQQDLLVNVLSFLDEKIELNNKINIELEEMAKTLYDYWFVQFEFPNEKGKPYKSSGGKMVYNKELLREIPDGWQISYLKDLALLNPTLSLRKGTISPYIQMSSIPTDGYMTGLPEQKEFSGGIKFQNNDIVLARITPCLENGKTALITLLDGEDIGFGSTEFINIRAKMANYVSFLAILSRSHFFRSFAISKMTGTSGRKRVDAKDVGEFKMVIPTEPLFKKFSEIIDPFFEKMTFNAKQNQELAQLRDWLLPMLMNGQVKVK